MKEMTNLEICKEIARVMLNMLICGTILTFQVYLLYLMLPVYYFYLVNENYLGLLVYLIVGIIIQWTALIYVFHMSKQLIKHPKEIWVNKIPYKV